MPERRGGHTAASEMVILPLCGCWQCDYRIQPTRGRVHPSPRQHGAVGGAQVACVFVYSARGNGARGKGRRDRGR